jgi:hypothetical protein
MSLKIRSLIALAAGVLFGSVAVADTVVELGTLKSKAPESWKEEPASNTMRVAQFKVPKAEGDKEDAEAIVFYFKGGSGSVDANLKRQLAKFEPGEGEKEVKSKVDKIMVGPIEATYQDLQGTYLSKFPPFAPNAKITRKPDYRQLYVAVTVKEGDYYVLLLGPAKTVEKHKKEYDEFLKNFK